jgi:hypothetical protein
MTRLSAIRDAAEQAQRHQQLADAATGDDRARHLAAVRAHLAAVEAMARAEREGR